MGLGLGLDLVKRPPAQANDLGLGLGLTATYAAVVLVNPCSTVGTPRDLILACVSQSGSLSGWVGQAVTVSYNSGAGNWQGTLTKGGNSGTITFVGIGSGTCNFSGTSSGHWTLSSNLSNDTVTCGPPLSGTSGNHNTLEGLNSGNTTWSIQPA
jgi:hypothetical protein